MTPYDTATTIQCAPRGGPITTRSLAHPLAPARPAGTPPACPRSRFTKSTSRWAETRRASGPLGTAALHALHLARCTRRETAQRLSVAAGPLLKPNHDGLDFSWSTFSLPDVFFCQIQARAARASHAFKDKDAILLAVLASNSSAFQLRTRKVTTFSSPCSLHQSTMPCTVFAPPWTPARPHPSQPPSPTQQHRPRHPRPRLRPPTAPRWPVYGASQQPLLAHPGMPKPDRPAVTRASAFNPPTPHLSRLLKGRLELSCLLLAPKPHAEHLRLELPLRKVCRESDFLSQADNTAAPATQSHTRRPLLHEPITTPAPPFSPIVR